MKRNEAIFLFVIYILGIIWIIAGRAYGWKITVCPIKLLSGLPCPGCGTTRAIEMVLDGDMIGGIMMNPNIILVAAIAMGAPFILAANFLYGKDYMRIADRWLNRRPVFISLIFFEMTIWMYNIVRMI
ncbi:DUF2752 domain-containing protein [Prevotella sp.]|uniref:DUF2752 domain-containing protein n=1 Tax=Prevotella sp. TaxID=59823 RepID=UPI003F7FDA57